MDGDEIVVLVMSVPVGAGFLIGWVLGVARMARVLGWTPARRLLLATPFACLALLLAVLLAWADPVVSGHAGYLLLFTASGATWMLVLTLVMRLLGIDPVEDSLRSTTRAGVIATCGALLGVTLVYAGANIGVGPTIWTTFVPALLATLAWLAAWTVAQLVGGFAEAIAVERDEASGWRLAALLVANGLVLGRAAAGDWISVEDTWDSLVRVGWPVLLLTVLAGVLQRLRVVGRTASESSLCLVMAAVVWVITRGAW